MSVIMECQKGDPIVFIMQDVVLCEVGIPFSWDKSREFHIGDVVYYEDGFKDQNEPQDYLSWMVVFKTDDGKTYSASQLYFVTVDQWEDLANYFNNHFQGS